MAWLAQAALFALVVAPGGWKPVTETTTTVWARAGGRSWTLCEDLGRQAASVSVRERGGREAENVWRGRAARCPHSPTLLVLAARAELVGSVQPLPGVERDAVERAVVAQRGALERALSWLTAALAESRRRSATPPPETRYLRAYVLLGLGKLDGARRGLEDARRHGEVERWRHDRMRAVIELLSGDLDGALRLSYRAVLESPGTESNEQQISSYIFSYVLDRAGAPHEALRRLRSLRRRTRDDSARIAVESLLPAHERLYLRALSHQANDETASAKQLWSAYLSRPEPEDPERVLARRHVAELEPIPPPSGP